MVFGRLLDSFNDLDKDEAVEKIKREQNLPATLSGLPYEELVAILTRATAKQTHSTQEAEAVFAKADKNGDGRVDIEEFAAAWSALRFCSGSYELGFAKRRSSSASSTSRRARHFNAPRWQYGYDVAFADVCARRL